MTVDHYARAVKLAKALADRVEAGENLRELVDAHTKDLPRTTRDWLALEAMDNHVRYELRERTRSEERLAVVPASAQERPSKPGPVHGSFNKRTGAIPRGCDCDKCEEARTASAEIDARYRAKMQGILDEYAASLRMEWTEELLASSFALSDGVRVLWGDATIEQHRERAQMFTANAQANTEGAARHLAAIRDLRAAGVERLHDLPTPPQQNAA